MIIKQTIAAAAIGGLLFTMSTPVNANAYQPNSIPTKHITYTQSKTVNLDDRLIENATEDVDFREAKQYVQNNFQKFYDPDFTVKPQGKTSEVPNSKLNSDFDISKTSLGGKEVPPFLNKVVRFEGFFMKPLNYVQIFYAEVNENINKLNDKTGKDLALVTQYKNDKFAFLPILVTNKALEYEDPYGDYEPTQEYKPGMKLKNRQGLVWVIRLPGFDEEGRKATSNSFRFVSGEKGDDVEFYLGGKDNAGKTYISPVYKLGMDLIEEPKTVEKYTPYKINPEIDKVFAGALGNQESPLNKLYPLTYINSVSEFTFEPEELAYDYDISAIPSSPSMGALFALQDKNHLKDKIKLSLKKADKNNYKVNVNVKNLFAVKDKFFNFSVSPFTIENFLKFLPESKNVKPQKLYNELLEYLDDVKTGELPPYEHCQKDIKGCSVLFAELANKLPHNKIGFTDFKNLFQSTHIAVDLYGPYNSPNAKIKQGTEPIKTVYANLSNDQIGKLQTDLGTKDSLDPSLFWGNGDYQTELQIPNDGHYIVRARLINDLNGTCNNLARISKVEVFSEPKYGANVTIEGKKDPNLVSLAVNNYRNTHKITGGDKPITVTVDGAKEKIQTEEKGTIDLSLVWAENNHRFSTYYNRAYFNLLLPNWKKDKKALELARSLTYPAQYFWDLPRFIVEIKNTFEGDKIVVDERVQNAMLKTKNVNFSWEERTPWQFAPCHLLWKEQKVTEYKKPIVPPVTPSKPTDKPTTPETPVTPSTPSDNPPTPTDKPNTPDNPVRTQEPNKPQEPVKPVEPNKPAEPNKPQEPVKPTEPNTPVTPTTPVQPNVPENNTPPAPNTPVNTPPLVKTGINAWVSLASLIVLATGGAVMLLARKKQKKH